MCAAGELRGVPASTTATLRLARDSTKAADRPAAPPPTTTTSNSLLRNSLSFMSFRMAATAVLRQLLLLLPRHMCSDMGHMSSTGVPASSDALDR
jgi:hypothetical protein